MLRVIIAAVGSLCALAGILLILKPAHNGEPLIIFGAIVLLSLFFEGRYRTAKTTSSQWQQTGEKFIDPGSGKLVEVDYDPKTGERRYRE